MCVCVFVCVCVCAVYIKSFIMTNSHSHEPEKALGMVEYTVHLSRKPEQKKSNDYLGFVSEPANTKGGDDTYIFCFKVELDVSEKKKLYEACKFYSFLAIP